MHGDERFTFSDPRSRGQAGRHPVAEVDVTLNSAQDKTLLKRFHLFGPPGTIFRSTRFVKCRALALIGRVRGMSFCSA